jgi:hypothetical protein
MADGKSKCPFGLSPLGVRVYKLDQQFGVQKCGVEEFYVLAGFPVVSSNSHYPLYLFIF